MCVCVACVCVVCVGTLLVNKQQQLPLTWGSAVAHSEHFTGQNAHWELAVVVPCMLRPLVFPLGHITI